MSSRKAVVVDADPAWPERAADLASQLARALGPAALRIEHIGSTAIPAMAAKDVLDMQVSVADLASAAAAFSQPLASLGFVELPYHQDHVPAGRDDDPQLWSKRLFSRRGHTAGDVNLHVRIAGSPNERLALLFRDWFRAHPSAVAAYARFKQVLAEAVPDIGTYSDVKDPVVDLIIVTAEQWANTTQWRSAKVNAIGG